MPATHPPVFGFLPFFFFGGWTPFSEIQAPDPHLDVDASLFSTFHFSFQAGRAAGTGRDRDFGTGGQAGGGAAGGMATFDSFSPILSEAHLAFWPLPSFSGQDSL